MKSVVVDLVASTWLPDFLRLPTISRMRLRPNQATKELRMCDTCLTTPAFSPSALRSCAVSMQAAKASQQGAISPQDLCPSQRGTLPCMWTPDQLQAPSFGSVPVDLGNGQSIDILQVAARPQDLWMCLLGYSSTFRRWSTLVYNCRQHPPRDMRNRPARFCSVIDPVPACGMRALTKHYTRLSFCGFVGLQDR